MLKTSYTTHDKKKSNNLVNMINSGLGDLKMKLEIWMKKKMKLQNQMR